MRDNDRLPENLQTALSNGLLKRLPITFLPFVNQQLNQWDHLFPNERQSIERLLLYVAGLSPEQSASLFRDVVEIEEKMGVRQWEFSTTEQTILNSSQLARSPYFQDWRRAVQAGLRCCRQSCAENQRRGGQAGKSLGPARHSSASARRCSQRLAPLAGNRPANETRSRAIQRKSECAGTASYRHPQRGRRAFRRIAGCCPEPLRCFLR
jgi:predicted component of type VI protein secretion system